MSQNGRLSFVAAGVIMGNKPAAWTRSFDKRDSEADGFIVALEVRDSERMYPFSKIYDVSVSQAIRIFASHLQLVARHVCNHIG